MNNTQERLAALQFEIATLREQLAEIADLPDQDHQRMYLFRELVYSLTTYDALLRKYGGQPTHGLRRHAVNQHTQPL
jgi:hypothetical protein